MPSASCERAGLGRFSAGLACALPHGARAVCCLHATARRTPQYAHPIGCFPPHHSHHGLTASAPGGPKDYYSGHFNGNPQTGKL